MKFCHFVFVAVIGMTLVFGMAVPSSLYAIVPTERIRETTDEIRAIVNSGFEDLMKRLREKGEMK